MRLQQQQLTIRAKLDRAYDDRLSGRIPDDLWTSKSAELEEELRRVRAEMAGHERASHDYERTGLQILELAQTAYSLYVTQNAHEQARLNQNAAIELHVRPRNSLSHLQKAVRSVRARE
jgi:hypothetical protein